MKVDIKIDGLADLKNMLSGFSDRRVRAVGAEASTGMVREIEQGWSRRLADRIDRPTPGTMKAIGVKKATARDSVAEVFIKDRGQPGRLTPEQWLSHHEYGGDRLIRKFEQSLIRQGAMPSGCKVVPGAGAKLDAYGNISRGQIVQVLTQLGTQLSPGYQRVISKSVARRLAAAKRHGREYVAVARLEGRKGRPFYRLRPGVYERRGRELVPVFLYVSVLTYRKRLGLLQSAEDMLIRGYERRVRDAVMRHAALAAAKRGGV